jgi:hypothetical protein
LTSLSLSECKKADSDSDSEPDLPWASAKDGKHQKDAGINDLSTEARNQELRTRTVPASKGFPDRNQPRSSLLLSAHPKHAACSAIFVSIPQRRQKGLSKNANFLSHAPARHNGLKKFWELLDQGHCSDPELDSKA